jgi:hypothetical protein
MPTQDVTIRKAPRLAVFVGTGAILGIVAAAIATFSFPVDPAVGALATWGFFSIVFSIVGMGLLAAIALIIDRRTRSHSGTARVTKKKP